MIRRFPNVETRCGKPASRVNEHIVYAGKRGELNHLSNLRKRKKLDFLSSGERTGKSLNPAAWKPASVVRRV